jgi:soluble lytic murein transglycosylase
VTRYDEHMSKIAALSLALLVSFSMPAYAGIDTDVANWLQLRNASKKYDFQTYARFLNAHPDWPESGAMTYRAEDALLSGGSNAALVQWFSQHPPQTDAGRLRYVIALEALGQSQQAATRLKEYWHSGAFNENLQAQIMRRYGGWLSGTDQSTRLQNLLWKGQLDRAAKSMEYVSDPIQKQIARARTLLQRNSSTALATVNGLPQAARLDNGVILDLARYYRQRDMDTKAVQTLDQRQQDVGPHAALWWRERSLLARRFLERGNYKTAYAVAHDHGFSSGPEFAEAEWMAGWMAVTRLRAFPQAYSHFDHMYRNVKTPISIARASYWAGIAADQMKEHDLANQWYRVSAVHMNTFYGQLAAYALGNPKDHFANFFAKSKSPKSFSTDPLRSDLIGGARLLKRMGKTRESNAFLLAAMRKATEDKAVACIINVALELDNQTVALQAAKAAYERGVLVADALFPRPAVPPSRLVENALTLSIIRQESLFDRYAQSPAGARGLMQLMPGTAKLTAQQNGIPHSSVEQLFQPTHNMMLGQAYLGKMLNSYDGFVPLAAAAYNGGPGNVNKWLNAMGDPRKDPFSWVDWVERIPFYETRNYVQRIWESYTAYQYLHAHH